MSTKDSSKLVERADQETMTDIVTDKDPNVEGKDQKVDDPPKGLCHLLRLLIEVRENIYSFLFGDNTTKTNLSTAKARRNFQPKYRLQNDIPVVFKDISALLCTHPTIFEEIKDFNPRSTTYFNIYGDAQADMSAILTTDQLSHVVRFEMRAEWHLKVHHRRYWPGVITSLCAMPQLEYFRLYSETQIDAPPYPQRECGDPDGSVTKYQQEYRSLLLLGAFIELRHPNLDLMVQPAGSGPSYKTGEWLVVHEFHLKKFNSDRLIRYNKITKFVGPAPIPKDEFDLIERDVIQVEDEIINATAARRLKWTDACSVDPSSLYIAPPQGGSKSDITTSEVASEDHQHFSIVDQRAYQPFELFRQNHWPVMGHLDGMIERCLQLKANHERVQQSAANGRGRGRGGGRGRARGRGGRFQVAIHGGRGRGRGGTSA